MNIKKKSKRLLLLLIAILLSFTSAMTYIQYGIDDKNDNNNEFQKGFLESGRLSFASFKGFSFTEKANDDIRFQIKAEKVFVRNEKLGFFRVALQKVLEMENVQVEFNENNSEVLSVRSDQAILYTVSKNVLFEGNVMFSSNDGSALKTDKILWNTKKERFETDEEFTYMNVGGSISNGKGFESDNRLRMIKFGHENEKMSKRGNF